MSTIPMPTRALKGDFLSSFRNAMIRLSLPGVP
jgi:hypothetical protein